jgi:phosphatidylglycerophosphatase A
MKNLIKLIATGFGTGYSPIAPGTCASVLAAFIYWFLMPSNDYYCLFISIFIFFIAVMTAGNMEKYFNKKDDSRIVIDEIIGYFASVLFIPRSLIFFAAAFLLFRFFDIAKPLFIKKVQDWHGGWGVVCDDLFAGIATNLILQLVRIVCV